MSLQLLPEKVRKSVLIQVLARKVEQGVDSEFDCLGTLVKLEKIVSAEVGYINQLFDEYTPHDSKNHLDRLYSIADRLIEKKRYEKMNVMELFVLACGIYAHDWGMAVSKATRDAVADHLKNNKKPADFAIAWELKQVKAYAEKRGLALVEAQKKEGQGYIADLEQWRNYVRDTHAERSAFRIEEFFREEPVGGLGYAVGALARGHCVDVCELNNDEAYPTEYTLNSEVVNLRALTIYVRLVDLLDIGANRTPYAIWNFVSPTDPKSLLEWKKHFALKPVAFGKNSRVIKFGGNTKDPEVWAGLRDLERYVKDQVEACGLMLERLKEDYFALGIVRVEWDVKPIGFKKIDLRFEFQRERMFEILSNEIYDGDTYVFLRELLQNSIDAIKLRRGLRKDSASFAETNGLIRFQVVPQEDGSLLVSCQDDGVGMDEYIVRNYLAMAGKSYYSSEDFNRLGVKMDAISRFGIGILSCFMAGDSLKIETCQEPKKGASRDPLRIEIPSVKHQFRVYMDEPDFEVGTRVTVKVGKDKLKMMSVTDYLAGVGAFSEFPILVSEGGRHTLIVHPLQNGEKALAQACQQLQEIPKDSITLRQLSRSYPWEEVFYAQDMEKAREMFEEEIIDVQKDLKLKDVEGWITFLVPKDKNGILTRQFINEAAGARVIIGNASTRGAKDARYYTSRSRHYRRKTVPASIQGDGVQYTNVRGIFVPFFGRYYGGRSYLPMPSININVTQPFSLELNIARNQLRQMEANWSNQIWREVGNYVLKQVKWEDFSAKDRFINIGRFMAYYDLSIEQIGEEIGRKKWPVLWVNKKRSLEFIDYEECPKLNWPVFPLFFMEEAERFIKMIFSGKEREVAQGGTMKNWGGAAAIVSGVSIGQGYIDCAMDFLEYVYQKTMPIECMAFMRIPMSTGVCPQSILFPATQKKKEEDLIMRRVFVDKDKLSVEDWYDVVAILNRFDGGDGDVDWRKYKAFLPPFEEYFALGCSYFNIKHPFTQFLIRCSLKFKVLLESRAVPEVYLGRIVDSLKKLRGATIFPKDRYHETLTEYVQQLVCEFDAAGHPVEFIVPTVPELSEYVAGSFYESGEQIEMLIFSYGFASRLTKNHKFGKRIEVAPKPVIKKPKVEKKTLLSSLKLGRSMKRK